MAKRKTPLTPQEEERRADQRRKNLEKAREVRLAKQKKELDEKVWALIGPMKVRRKCKCKIRKGMTLDQLRPLNAGCTAGTGFDPGWVCSVLDAYRRYLEDPRIVS